MSSHQSSASDLSVPDSTGTKQSRIISRVLSPAVRLWLRSQLDHVEDLQFSIQAGDRQILSGSIDQVTVAASKAIYRGLHLSQVNLTAQQIRTNLHQVLRGQPLRLMAAFPLVGDVLLYEADLNASLRSPLLEAGIVEFLLLLLKAGLDPGGDLAQAKPRDVRLQDPQILLAANQLTLAATLIGNDTITTSVVLQTGFRLEEGNRLRLDRPQRLPHLGAEQGIALDYLDGYTFHLGSAVYFEELTLESGQVFCRGQVTVTPEE